MSARVIVRASKSRIEIDPAVLAGQEKMHFSRGMPLNRIYVGEESHSSRTEGYSFGIEHDLAQRELLEAYLS